MCVVCVGVCIKELCVQAASRQSGSWAPPSTPAEDCIFHTDAHGRREAGDQGREERGVERALLRRRQRLDAPQARNNEQPPAPEAEHAHAPVADGCLGCHRPHGGPEPALLEQPLGIALRGALEAAARHEREEEIAALGLGDGHVLGAVEHVLLDENA